MAALALHFPLRYAGSTCARLPRQPVRGRGPRRRTRVLSRPEAAWASRSSRSSVTSSTGAPAPEATGAFSNHPLRPRLRREDDRARGQHGRPRRHPRRHGRTQHPRRGGAEARRLGRRRHLQGARPLRPPLPAWRPRRPTTSCRSPTFKTGKYVLLYDPLDGSSNIDANVSIGTIFSIHRKITDGERGTERTACSPAATGRRRLRRLRLVHHARLYDRHGVHGFTLDPSIGEFLLSHPDIRIPTPGKRIYSVNEGNYANWSRGSAPSSITSRVWTARNPSRSRPATSAPSSPTSTARCSTAASSCTRPTQEPRWQAPPALRGRAAGLHRGAGRRPRLHRPDRHPGRAALCAPPARAALHRLEGVRGPGRRRSSPPARRRGRARSGRVRRLVTR
jgi:hypothetical protein